MNASVGGYVDHVHLLVGFSRTLTIAGLVEHVKTETSKWAKTVADGTADFRWQNGYGVFSVSHSMKDKVDLYIRNQSVHHTSRPFQDEYRQLCQRHGIHIDERYVWD